MAFSPYTPEFPWRDARIDRDLYDHLSVEERRRRTVGQARRRAGAMLGMAVGDALGAPYEFKPSQGVVLAGTSADMTGGGQLGWEPGEWTDDTAMAIPLIRSRRDHDRGSLDAVVQEWRQWALESKDVGIQTRDVLSRLGGASTAADARAAALDVHTERGRSGGNGSLMRTAPVGLWMQLAPAGFFSPSRTVAAIVGAARAQSELTHADPNTGEACVLWSIMIHMAVTHGVVDAEDAVKCLPRERRERWSALLAEAAGASPGDFPNNGWVVHALQAAWAALHRAGFDLADAATATPDRFRLALQHAINAGGDTDTVAAITGALAGAFVGADAIPLGWTRMLHGWGGDGVVMGAGELARLVADAAANQGGDRYGPYVPQRTLRVDYSAYGDCSMLAAHPHDSGVLLGGVGVLDALPDAVDAVVSLCRIGDAQVPQRIGPRDRVEVWLIDRPEPVENPSLDFVLGEAADAVAALRAEGKTVLLHCVQAQSRTPAVAALYAARHRGAPVERALNDVATVLPGAALNPAFREVLVGEGEASAFSS